MRNYYSEPDYEPAVKNEDAIYDSMRDRQIEEEYERERRKPVKKMKIWVHKEYGFGITEDYKCVSKREIQTAKELWQGIEVEAIGLTQFELLFFLTYL